MMQKLHSGFFGMAFTVQKIEPDKKTVSAMSALTTDDLTPTGSPIRFIPPGMDNGAMGSAGAKNCRGYTDKPIVRGKNQRIPSNIPRPRLLVQS